MSSLRRDVGPFAPRRVMVELIGFLAVVVLCWVLCYYTAGKGYTVSVTLLSVIKSDANHKIACEGHYIVRLSGWLFAQFQKCSNTKQFIWSTDMLSAWTIRRASQSWMKFDSISICCIHSSSSFASRSSEIISETKPVNQQSISQSASVLFLFCLLTYKN